MRALRYTKAQIKMFESIAVIIVFMMLLIFGFFFYVSVSKGSSQSAAEAKKYDRAMRLSKIVSSLPELQCSNGEPVDLCIDSLKVEAFQKDQNALNTYYFDLLGYSKVCVQKIFPSSIPEDCKMIYEKQKSGSKSSVQYNVPVSYFDPNTDQSYFAMLSVSSYG